MLLVCCIGAGLLAGCGDKPEKSDKPDVIGCFGRTGRGPGEFLYPRAIELLPNGQIVVLDKAGVARRFASGPRYESLCMFPMPKIDNGKPTGLTVLPRPLTRPGDVDKIFVADTHNHRVLILTPSGKILGQFGNFGEGPGEFIYPTDVAFDSTGRIFVSEYGGNDRVSVFSPDPKREFLFSFGGPGEDRGELARPAALCIDSSRKLLYVADACNHRIAVYTLDGKLLRYIGSQGRAAGQLRYPYDLALLSDGRLVVCEYGNNRIQVFSPTGESVSILGHAGRKTGELAYPWGVAVDSDDKVYIVDAGNNRVQVWQL